MGILQARILEWVATPSSSMDSIAGLYCGIQLLLNFFLLSLVELHIIYDSYQLNIKLTLEKSKLKLHRSTYRQMWVFFIVNCTVLPSLWLVESTDMEEA